MRLLRAQRAGGDKWCDTVRVGGTNQTDPFHHKITFRNPATDRQGILHLSSYLRLTCETAWQAAAAAAAAATSGALGSVGPSYCIWSYWQVIDVSAGLFLRGSSRAVSRRELVRDARASWRALQQLAIRSARAQRPFEVMLDGAQQPARCFPLYSFTSEWTDKKTRHQRGQKNNLIWEGVFSSTRRELSPHFPPPSPPPPLRGDPSLPWESWDSWGCAET